MLKNWIIVLVIQFFFVYLQKKMKKELFEAFIHANIGVIEDIKSRAAKLHDIDCNQKYGDEPYSFHLNMVADAAMEYGHLVCFEEKHIIPIVFGAYFHDSIEDARVTYNDVMKIAKGYMDDDQALIAVEIVYALTDEKGRNREERGSAKHYEDIRKTLYAPFVKWCDRYANFKHSIEVGSRMAKVYWKEMPLFLAKLGEDKFIGKELYEIILNLG